MNWKRFSNPTTGLCLDVDAPDKVSPVLERAAMAFYHSANELEASWQDPNAGKVWEKIATELSKSAERIDRIVKKYY